MSELWIIDRGHGVGGWIIVRADRWWDAREIGRRLSASGMSVVDVGKLAVKTMCGEEYNIDCQWVGQDNGGAEVRRMQLRWQRMAVTGSPFTEWHNIDDVDFADVRRAVE